MRRMRPVLVGAVAGGLLATAALAELAKAADGVCADYRLVGTGTIVPGEAARLLLTP